jgi:hypothetical protein
MDFSNLSSSDQAKMSAIIEKKQMTDFMALYSNLVDRQASISNNNQMLQLMRQ